MLVWTPEGHREALAAARLTAEGLERALVWTERTYQGLLGTGGAVADRSWSAPLPGSPAFYVTIEDAGPDKYMGRHQTQGAYCWSLALKRTGSDRMIPEILATVMVGAPDNGLPLAKRCAARWIAWLSIPELVKGTAAGPETLADDWLDVIKPPVPPAPRRARRAGPPPRA